MSTISGRIDNNYGITLSSSGSYTSPLSITSTGFIDGGFSNNGANHDAIFGPAGSTWTVNNDGVVTAPDRYFSGIRLNGGGSVGNTGTITSYGIAVLIGGTLVNSGTILGEGAVELSIGPMATPGRVTARSASR